MPGLVVHAHDGVIDVNDPSGDHETYARFATDAPSDAELETWIGSYPSDELGRTYVTERAPEGGLQLLDGDGTYPMTPRGRRGFTAVIPGDTLVELAIRGSGVLVFNSPGSRNVVLVRR